MEQVVYSCQLVAAVNTKPSALGSGCQWVKAGISKGQDEVGSGRGEAHVPKNLEGSKKHNIPRVRGDDSHRTGKAKTKHKQQQQQQMKTNKQTKHTGLW